MKSLSMMSLLLLSFHTQAMICGEDDRLPARDPRIGRMKLSFNDTGCTATMISKNCALTAGHCLAHMKTMEFNVPLSIRGRPQFSEARDVYQVDQSN